MVAWHTICRWTETQRDRNTDTLTVETDIHRQYYSFTDPIKNQPDRIPDRTIQMDMHNKIAHDAGINE